MSFQSIVSTPSAYAYPLLVKQLLHTPRATAGERPLAMIVLKAEQTVTADEIKAHVQRFAEEGHISRYAVPDQVRFVDSLARTSVGKLNKKAMREQLAG